MNFNIIDQNKFLNNTLADFNSNISVQKVERVKNTNDFICKNCKDNVEEAISKVNKLLEGQNVHAEYSVHEDFKNTVMVKVIDDKTKRVILEIPCEKILDMIASLCKQYGLLDRKL